MPTYTVIDNTDVSGYTQTAGWSTVGSSGHNGGYVYAASGSGSEVATFTFTGLTPGTFKVGITWQAFSNRATNTPVKVYDSNGTTLLGTFAINQVNAPNGSAPAPDADPAVWQDLYGLGFTITGTSIKVTIDNNANGFVIADAVYITAGVPPATSYTLTGHKTGQINVDSLNFYVTPNGPYIGTITPAATTVTGTLNPTSLTWSATGEAKPFVFKPTSGTGTATISATSSPGLTNPPSLSYLVTAAPLASSYTLTGPATGYLSSASTNFTVTPNALYTGTITPQVTGVTATVTPSSLSWTSSNAAKTFTITPTSGTGNATVSATSSPSLTDPTSLPYAVFSTTGQQIIDSAWLTANVTAFGGPPYCLGLAFGSYSAATKYLMSVDATAEGVAFYILAANVLLDLGGHTITYDNNTPPGVANGGFETDAIGATTITSWDVTGASGAIIAAARVGYWGSKMLHIPSIAVSTTNTIVSNPITIPKANVEYCAVIQAKLTAGNATLTLSVVDNVTSSVLGSAASSDPQRGTAAFVQFTPTTTNAVKLKLDCASTSGTAAVDIDHADLTRSRTAGVACGPSYYNLSSETTANSTIAANASASNGSTIRSGTITQGTGRSYGASPLYARSITAVTVDGITATSAGSSTSQVEGSFSTGPIIVNNCTLTNSMDLVDDRQRSFCAIHFDNFAGAAIVTGNTLRGTQQNGIGVSGPYLAYTDPLYLTSPSPVTNCVINNNDIRVNAYWTDSYGIGVSGAAQFEIGSNTVIPINGRGMYIDGNSGITKNGEIHDNYIEARERPNMEYDQTGIEATGLRIRSGTIKNCNFRNNSFVAYTDIGLSWACAGARISQLNGWNSSAHDNDNSNNLFTNCLFKGIVLNPDTGLSAPNSSNAWGLTLSRVDTGTGLKFVDCTFESNAVSINIGDNDSSSGDEHDVTFLSPIIKKSTEGSGMAHYGIVLGDWGNNVSDIRIYDPDYAGLAVPGITFLSTPVKDATIGGLLDLTVNNANATPAVGASVTINNAVPTLVYSGTTNGSGQILGIPLLTTKYSQLTTDPNAITQTSYNPFALAATLGGSTASGSLTMTDDATQTLTLSGAQAVRRKKHGP
jgi:hypothetical protein